MVDAYKDPSRSVEERVGDLLPRMRVEEKIAQMHALWLILSEDGQHRPRNDDFTGGSCGSDRPRQAAWAPRPPRSRSHAGPERGTIARNSNDPAWCRHGGRRCDVEGSIS